MNDVEHKRWLAFQREHKEASRLYREHYSTGIGDKILAIAVYDLKTLKEDISDYDSW